MTETSSPPKRTGLLIWMILSQILAVLSLLPWLLMAGLSVMAFDQGSSPEAWAVVIAAWIAYKRRRNVLAAVLSGFSFAPPLLCIAVMLISNWLWFAQNGGLDAFRP